MVMGLRGAVRQHQCQLDLSGLRPATHGSPHRIYPSGRTPLADLVAPASGRTGAPRSADGETLRSGVANGEGLGAASVAFPPTRLDPESSRAASVGDRAGAVSLSAAGGVEPEVEVV